MNRYLKSFIVPLKIFAFGGIGAFFMILCRDQLGPIWGSIVIFTSLFALIFLDQLRINK